MPGHGRLRVMLPLEGVRVVEATQMVAGPFAGAVFAEQGAEVIKVEQPDGLGDRYRLIGHRRGAMGANFQLVNRGKRSIALDTKHPDGLAVMRDLIASADVFIQNFRPGTVERLGIGPDVVCAAHPDLIYVSVSGFGPTGPDVDQKVYDYVIQARSGMAALQADEMGGRPKLINQVVVDKVTAMTVSQAVTAALFARERGQGGSHVQLAMLDVGAWFFWGDGMMDKTLLGDDITPAPHVSEAYGMLQTRDGWISLMTTGSERSWPKICAAFGPDMQDDPRFAGKEDREANVAELVVEFERRLAALTTEEALEAMRTNDVPGASVTSRDEVHLDPQLVHNETLVEVDDGLAGPRREPRPPIAFGGNDSRQVPAAAPGYGADTADILGSLGYGAERIRTLREAGVLGPSN